jgi:hypothetical protein
MEKISLEQSATFQMMKWQLMIFFTNLAMQKEEISNTGKGISSCIKHRCGYHSVG